MRDEGYIYMHGHGSKTYFGTLTTIQLQIHYRRSPSKSELCERGVSVVRSLRFLEMVDTGTGCGTRRELRVRVTDAWQAPTSGLTWDILPNRPNTLGFRFV